MNRKATRVTCRMEIKKDPQVLLNAVQTEDLHSKMLEREKSLELSTSTLARLRSTN